MEGEVRIAIPGQASQRRPRRVESAYVILSAGASLPGQLVLQLVSLFLTTTISKMPSKKNKARASIKTAGAAAVASEGDSDAAAMKGPSSGRSPKHTVQLIIVLALQTSMLAFSMLYLPQGLGTQEGPKISFLSGIVDMLHADNVVMKMILALQGVLVSQAWFCGRFRWWWEYAQKMENNEIAEGTRAPTFMEQLEVRTRNRDRLHAPGPRVSQTIGLTLIPSLGSI